jgi:hypothetical protein
MKTLHPLKAQAQHFSYHLVTIVVAVLMVSLVPAAAYAAPPATVASCDGIKSAYNTLGTQCANAYAKISHAPANASQRLASFKARVAVLEIFQKAMLCNGMFGASAQAQQAFRTGEDGHLTALANLRTAMTAAGDPNIPAAYTADDLNGITIKKLQCK